MKGGAWRAVVFLSAGYAVVGTECSSDSSLAHPQLPRDLRPAHTLRAQSCDLVAMEYAPRPADRLAGLGALFLGALQPGVHTRQS